VGITDAIAKHVAYRLIAPAMDLEARISVNCIEGSLQSLGDKLADHTLDVLLADRPIDRHIMPKCQNFLLHESQLSFMCVPALAPPGEFPMNLDRQPFLTLTEHHNLAHQLHAWFQQHNVHPDIVGRFDDSALLKAFARSGRGICAIPSMIEAEVSREYGLVCIGKSAELGEKYYAVMVPRKVDHPGVTAICTTGAKQ
jgi:LysR family transcriptional activator of nhaA